MSKRRLLADLSEEEVAWIVENFRMFKNKEIQERFNITRHTLRIIKAEYGLEKSAELLSSIQAEATESALKRNKVLGFKPQRDCMRRLREEGRMQSFFTKENPLRLPPDREAQRRANIKKTNTELWQSERRRLMFGLPQKTNLRIVDTKFTKYRCSARCNLIRRGYEHVGNYVFSYSDETRRDLKLEEKYMNKCRFKFIQKENGNEGHII